MSATYPFSKLPAAAQANVAEYDNTPFITWVKQVLPDFFRVNITGASSKEMDKMLAEGWQVVNRGA